MNETGDSRRQPPSIAFVGLATSHPYADAATLIHQHPDASIHVWERDPERLDTFLRRFPSAVAHAELMTVARQPLDGVVVSMRPPDVAETVRALAGLNMPIFINKPAAATLEQLNALNAVVTPIADRVLSASVLRFSEPVQRMSERIDRARVLIARAVVRHDVGRWLRGSTDWQDDVRIGGGGIVTIGIHGLEMLASVLGTDFEIEFAMAEVRHLEGLKSEDTALIGVRWSDGILGVIELVGVAESESYAMMFETVGGPLEIALPAEGSDPFGYGNTLNHFLRMVQAQRDGRPIPSPVPWRETQAVLRGIVTAGEMARSSA